MKDQILRIHNFGSFLLVNNLLVGLDVFKKLSLSENPELSFASYHCICLTKMKHCLFSLTLDYPTTQKLGAGVLATDSSYDLNIHQ